MIARVVALVLAVAILAYGGYRVWRRSLPPLPAVVARTVDVDALVAPPLAERLTRAVLGSAVDHRVAGPKLVALTFDDGPYPVDTPALLAALRAARVPATFFLIGRDAEQYPGLVRAIGAGGHELANHTETHPNLDQRSDDDVARELAQAATTLAAVVPDPAIRRFFRPPHGRFRPATLRVVQRAGYDTVLWTDDPGDWRSIGPAAIAAHVARYATSPEILLLHSGRPSTTRALPRLVDAFRAAGYRFVTVGEMLRTVTPDALNRAARTPLRSP